MHGDVIFDKEGCEMSMFQTWLRRKRMYEGLGDAGNLNGGEDFAVDHERIQTELFKTLMSKYPDETMQFVNGIAQRGDEEVASLLSKLKRDKKPQFNEPSHPSDGDEVVPANADTGYNSFGND